MTRPSRIALWKRLGVAALVVVAGVMIWRAMGEGQVAPPIHRPRKADVDRALSGHKLELEDGQHVVYAGIRAPYMEEDEALFQRAFARNAELVDGRAVRLRFDTVDRDSKNRYLAYVFVQDTFVNEALVREGLAYVRLMPNTRRFADRLLAAQAEAQRKKRGVWSRKVSATKSSYLADPKYGQFHNITCEMLAKKPVDRLKTFRRRTRAIAAGFAPCDICKP